jgi:hypothetical protein
MSATLDRDHLAKILGMLGSAHDGEVIAAARQAERIRREAGATWRELLSPAPLAPRPAARMPQSLHDAIELCYERREHLTPWERDFIASIMRCRRRLSDKQIDVLDRITRKVLAAEMAA